MEFKMPMRPDNAHKGTFGKVLNIAGSDYMPGAAYLSSKAALKTGCGYCFLASSERAITAVAAQTQNIVFLPFNKIKEQNPDVISIGCGLTTSDEAKSVFKETLCTHSDIPTIIDADGLNILAQTTTINLPKKLILTPHYMEAARLLNKPLEEIENDPEHYATEISKKYNCITILKGCPTVISKYGTELYLNNSANSALSKAGSGDVLTGIIAGLLAQGMDPFEASKLGIYLHSLCGEFAAKKFTKYSVMADDLINFIPNAINTILPEDSCY